MYISIIIPTLNEERCLGDLLEFLKADNSYSLVTEILVVDGSSKDRTVSLAQRLGARVISSPVPNRAVQMNLGAMKSTGAILYFLHADTFPPLNYAQSIKEAVDTGYSCGCFRLRFNWRHWFLNASSWFTRFSFRIFRFGDQSLFVERSKFLKVSGFKEDLKLFEDQDIVSRLKKISLFRVLADHVVTSARKYRRNGPYRLQLVYLLLYLLYTLGFPQRQLVRIYRSLIPYPMI